MPKADKSAYTGNQKRQAEHIEESYEKKDVSDEKAEEIAWATINKQNGASNLSGSGRKQKSSIDIEEEKVIKSKVRRKSSSVV